MPDDRATTSAPSAQVGPGGGGGVQAPAASEPQAQPQPQAGPPELGGEGGARAVEGGPQAPAPQAGPPDAGPPVLGEPEPQVDWQKRYSELRPRQQQQAQALNQLRVEHPEAFDDDGNYVPPSERETETVPELGGTDYQSAWPGAAQQPQTPYQQPQQQPQYGQQQAAAPWETDPLTMMVNSALANAQMQGPVPYQQALAYFHRQYPNLGLLPDAPQPQQQAITPQDIDRRIQERIVERERVANQNAKRMERGVDAMRAQFGDQFMDETVKYYGIEMTREEAAFEACEKFETTDPLDALRRAGDAQNIEKRRDALAYARALAKVDEAQLAQQLPHFPRQTLVVNPQGVSAQQLKALGYPTKPPQRDDRPRD